MNWMNMKREWMLEMLMSGMWSAFLAASMTDMGR